jgi:hypothetical protein
MRPLKQPNKVSVFGRPVGWLAPVPGSLHNTRIWCSNLVYYADYRIITESARALLPRSGAKYAKIDYAVEHRAVWSKVIVSVGVVL